MFREYWFRDGDTSSAVKVVTIVAAFCDIAALG
jgi:hypothetical protein